MANVQITIPQSFFAHMSQFMANVQKMQQLTNQLNQSIQRLPAAQNLYRQHHSVTSRMTRLLQTLRKMSAAMQRALDSIVQSFGAMAQTFMRGLALVSEALGPIIAITVTTVTVIASAAITASMFAAKIGRWFWDKMIGLGDSMLQDFLVASGIGTSIGGYRAFRTAFGRLPDDPGALMGMAQARGSVASQQFYAMRLLGVKASSDTTEMMVNATVAAAMFMKRQRRGQELAMASATALTSLISPQRLIALREMDIEEIKEMASLYREYKPLMEVTEKARRGWINFSLQVKATGVQIASIIAEKLADPNAPFTQAMTRLAKSLANFLQMLIQSPITGKLVKMIGEYIDELSVWMKKPETSQKITKLFNDALDVIKYVLEAIKLLAKMVADWRGTPTTMLHGRRALARKIGIERPTGAPPAAQPSAAPISRYPGRARFHEKIGVARKPGEPRIAGDVKQGGEHYVGGNTSVAMSAMMDQLRKEGVPEANVRSAAALLVGQAQAESNLNPNLSHDQGTGYGIYGARLGRRTAMLDWLKANGYAPNSLEGQSRYMAHEAMTGRGYGATRETLKRATPDSIDADSDVITRNFESPAVNNSRYRAGRTRDAYRAQDAAKPQPRGDYVKPGADAARRPLGPGAQSSNLADQRKRIGEELKDPEVKRLLAASTNAEVGGQGSDAEHAYIESTINRALSRKASLKDTLRDQHYYPATTKNKLNDPVSAADQARINDHTDKVLSGSNVTNYGTGNESGNVRSGGAQVTRDFGPRRERIIRENDDLDWVNDQLVKDGKQPLPKEAAKDPDSGQISARSGQGNLTTVGNYRVGGDSRRDTLIRAATDATKNLPPGWRVEAYSGQRNQGPHSHGAAIDFRIINDKGQEIPNYKTPGTFSIYEKFAQDTHLALQKIDPALAAQHRWGGYFSGSIAPDNAGGQYGAMDLMHQDFAGGDNRMAAGQWKTGLHPEWAQRWGVTDSSSGIADRARSNTASYQQAPNAPPSEAQKPWGAQAEPLPDYSNYHPINKVKVDNRSDQDVSHAKTSSDSDQGSSEPATEDNMPTDL